MSGSRQKKGLFLFMYREEEQKGDEAWEKASS